MSARRFVLTLAVVLAVSSVSAWADRHRADAALAPLAYAHESNLWGDGKRCCYSFSLPVHPRLHLSVFYTGGDVEGTRGSGADETRVGINVRAGYGLRYTFSNKVLKLPEDFYPYVQVATARVRIREENLASGAFTTRKQRNVLASGGIEWEWAEHFSVRAQGNLLFADFGARSKRVWGFTLGGVIGWELPVDSKTPVKTPAPSP
jgi:hypothetical protein